MVSHVGIIKSAYQEIRGDERRGILVRIIFFQNQEPEKKGKPSPGRPGLQAIVFYSKRLFADVLCQ